MESKWGILRKSIASGLTVTSPHPHGIFDCVQTDNFISFTLPSSVELTLPIAHPCPTLDSCKSNYSGFLNTGSILSYSFAPLFHFGVFKLTPCRHGSMLACWDALGEILSGYAFREIHVRLTAIVLLIVCCPFSSTTCSSSLVSRNKRVMEIGGGQTCFSLFALASSTAGNFIASDANPLCVDNILLCINATSRWYPQLITFGENSGAEPRLLFWIRKSHQFWLEHAPWRIHKLRRCYSHIGLVCSSCGAIHCGYAAFTRLPVIQRCWIHCFVCSNQMVSWLQWPHNAEILCLNSNLLPQSISLSPRVDTITLPPCSTQKLCILWFSTANNKVARKSWWILRVRMTMNVKRCR